MPHPEPIPGRHDTRADVESGAPGDDFVQVRGDWVALVALFGRASPVSMSHWNPRTGNVFELRAPSPQHRAKLSAAFEQQLWQDADWVEIPCQESDAAFAQIAAFVGALRPGKAKTQLATAIASPKPFRRFRQLMAGWPGVARRWQAVVDGEAALRLAEFCLSQNWRLADPRFEVAVVQWLDTTDATSDADAGEPEFPVAPATIRRVRLASASLALARSAAELAPP